MAKSFFTFGGRSSLDYGLTIEQYPDLDRPEVTYNTYTVPGRNARYYEPTGAHGMITVTYKVYFGTRVKGTAPEMAVQISEWLYSLSGYQELTDSYEPGYYRLGVFTGDVDITNVLSKYGECKLSFVCRPERYLVTNDITLTASGTLLNPTSFDAYPLITLSGGSSSGGITIGDTTLTASSLSESIVIDTETADVTYTDGSNANSIITLTDYAFPYLAPGSNTVALTGSATEAVIAPRYNTR